MKYLLCCLAFLTQTSFCVEKDIHRFTTANGIDVVLYENTASPAVIVGFVFDIGTIDVRAEQFGMLNLVLEDLIDKYTYAQLRNMGVTCSIEVSEESSDVVATVHQKNLKTLFQLLCRRLRRFSVTDAKLRKQSVIISYKMRHYNCEDCVKQALYMPVRIPEKNTCDALNESAIDSITLENAQKFVEDELNTCHLTIIVCGNVDRSTLENTINSTMTRLPKRKPIVRVTCEQTPYKDIVVENRFLAPSLSFVYKLPSNKTMRELSKSILLRELFDFLAVSNGYIRYCVGNDLLVKNGNVFQVTLVPEVDVSLKQLSLAYETFMNHLLHKHYGPNELSRIAAVTIQQAEFTLNDLTEMYYYLKSKELAGDDSLDIFHIQEMFDGASPQQISAFFKQEYKPLHKIITKYGTDI